MSEQPTVPSEVFRPGRGQDARGIDRELIRWFRTLTPAERLRVTQNNANAILKLRRGVRRTRSD
ncbi:MAG: hypothetical protein D6761_08905 [Candidatus Dadabacteria bacterium]|nr:MAG: hypothetical protein D6761_08905 [Candidatus Dadabacteria bacterium]